jgi:D-amino peptidase
MSPRVFVCADIEGVSGYVHPDQDNDDRAAVRRAMTADVNAVVDGVRDAVPDAEVVVADSHGDKRTISPDSLRNGVSLVRGGPRPLGMVDGASDADWSVLVGAHDKPGSGGHIEHVFTGAIADIELSDTAVGEVELNALLLEALDAPVRLVSGDDVLGETVAAVLPEAEYVTTKRARGTAAAECRAPDAVRTDLETAARTAADAAAAPLAVPVSFPATVRVTFTNAKLADAATLWPGVERGADSRTVRYAAADARDAYRFVRATTTVSP